MDKTRLIAGFLISALFTLFVGADAAAADKGQQRTQRGELVRQIVNKWGGHVQEAYGTNVRTWAMGMVPVFAKVSIPTLQRASTAITFDEMNRVLVPGGNAPRSGSSQLTTDASGKPRLAAKVLGDADRDLVFVPVTPCRILDTRIVGGQITGGTTRAFDITAVSDYSFQGGNNSNCGGVGAAGSFAAAAINFTVVFPSSAGYITAFPFGAVQPVSTSMDFDGGGLRSTTSIVRLDQGAAANEMTVYSHATTHLVADVVGYYINPGPLVFECQDTAEEILTVNAGATANVVAPVCPTGYTQTATNCESSTWQMPFVYFSGGTCSAQNNSSGTANLRASRTCCRARRT